MMRRAFLAVRGDAFDIQSIRPEIEDIGQCFGAYLAQVPSGSAGSKHRALGAVGKALQHARVARGDALLGYARRVHEQMTESTFASGAVEKLDEGLKKLDELLARKEIPARAAREILERVNYTTYYDVRRQSVEFQTGWKDFAGRNAQRLGIAADSNIPWFSKKKFALLGPQWVKLGDEYLASLRAPAPVVDLETDEEG
jgi:hypothetical protein